MRRTRFGCTPWLVLFTLCAALPSLHAESETFAEGFVVIYESPPAPALDLPGIDGRRRHLADLRGRVVVVNFWATWCPPCLEELPSMQRLRERLHARGLEVLAVNVGEDAQSIREFLDDFTPRLEFPVLLDAQGVAYREWAVGGLPRTVVVDKSGRMIYLAEGGRDMDSEHIRSRIIELLDRD